MRTSIQQEWKPHERFMLNNKLHKVKTIDRDYYGDYLTVESEDGCIFELRSDKNCKKMTKDGTHQTRFGSWLMIYVIQVSQKVK